jgi:hypothetical protein
VSFNAVSAVVLELTDAAVKAGPNRARAMLRAYFTALQREPQAARVFLVEIRGVSRAVDKGFDAALRSIGSEVAQMDAPWSDAG